MPAVQPSCLVGYPERSILYKVNLVRRLPVLREKERERKERERGGGGEGEVRGQQRNAK